VTMFIFSILLRIVIEAVNALKRRKRAAKSKALCNECAFAHIQFGACGRRAISCTFGGGVRMLKLDVLYCTDYRPRTAPVRAAIGFVGQVAVERN
jgi:hypothetical protein